MPKSDFWLGFGFFPSHGLDFNQIQLFPAKQSWLGFSRLDTGQPCLGIRVDDGLSPFLIVNHIHTHAVSFDHKYP
jgi:hypothetical protein